MDYLKTIENNKKTSQTLRLSKRVLETFKTSLDKSRQKVYTMYIRCKKGGCGMNATVKKWGNSQGIRFPKHILEAAKIKVDDEVSVEVENGSIIIKKATPHPTIEELFTGYKGNCDLPEIDWGEPVGEEVW